MGTWASLYTSLSLGSAFTTERLLKIKWDYAGYIVDIQAVLIMSGNESKSWAHSFYSILSIMIMMVFRVFAKPILPAECSCC